MLPESRTGVFWPRVCKVNPLALQITKQSKLKREDARAASERQSVYWGLSVRNV